MNLFDFYFKQIVTQSVMDWAFEQAETSDHFQNVDSLSVGIMEGFEVNENNLGADMSVDVLQGVAYSLGGSRIDNQTSLQNQACDVDEYGVDTTVQTAGNEKWLSVFARFDRRLEDPAIDGNNLQVYTRQYEDCEIIVRQGAEATSGTAAKPALISGAVLLADVQLSYGQTTIQNSHINYDRRQDWMRYVGANIGEKTFGNPHDAITEVFDILDGWAASGSPFSFTEDWGFSYPVEGPTPPITTVSEALNAIPYDLGRTTGRIGAYLIGAGSLSGTYINWTNASVFGALNNIAGATNSHIGGGSPYHPSTAITQAAKSGVPYSIPSTDVDDAVELLLQFVNETIIAPETAPSAPVLLWRSHGAESTADIINDTMSIYWENGGHYWIVQGLYMSANGTFNTNATAGGLCHIWGFGNGFISHGLKSCGINETFTYSQCDDYETVNPDLSKTRFKTADYPREYWIGSHSAQPTPQIAKTRIWYVDSLQLAFWVSGDDGTLGTGGFYITYNAEWDNSTNNWEAADASLQTACCIEISTAGVMIKNITDEHPSYASSWSDSGWTRIVRFSSLERQQEAELPADTNYNCAQIEGDVFERFCSHSNGYVGETGATVLGASALNYRNKRYDVPTTFSVVDEVRLLSPEGGGGATAGAVSTSISTPTGFTASDYEHWGMFVVQTCTWDAAVYGGMRFAAIIDIY